MQGQYCRLEPFDIQLHAAGLFAVFSSSSNEGDWTYLPYGPFTKEEDFVQWCRQTCVAHDPAFQTLVDQRTDRVMGLASFLRIAPEAGSIEVGHIHFSPLIQGTRQATEAMYLMMCRVFDELGYRRYEWKCDALNARSCRAAERFGFQFEGIFRQATVYKNRNRDTAWFSIIDAEWPKMKVAYEQWLNKANFDENGQQVLSLRDCLAH